MQSKGRPPPRKTDGLCGKGHLESSVLRRRRVGGGRLRRSAMNWSNSVLSLAKRRRSRKSRNSRCSSSSRFRVSAAVFVEGVIAARRRVVPGAATHLAAHPVHLALHAFHLVLPAVGPAVISASHSSAPYGEGEDGQAQRPPGHEAEDDQRDPGGFAEFIELRGDWHCRPRVNVNNIYIARVAADRCQDPSHRKRRRAARRLGIPRSAGRR